MSHLRQTSWFVHLHSSHLHLQIIVSVPLGVWLASKTKQKKAIFKVLATTLDKCIISLDANANPKLVKSPITWTLKFWTHLEFAMLPIKLFKLGFQFFYRDRSLFTHQIVSAHPLKRHITSKFACKHNIAKNCTQTQKVKVHIIDHGKTLVEW